MRIGYARVSTANQELDMQLRAFESAGVNCVVTEKKSGVSDRPELRKLLRILRPGDELIVWRLDRLARSLVDLLAVLQSVESSGASFRSLNESIETVTPAGRMVVQMLAAFAEYERALIADRARAGMQAARARGVRFGVPPRIDRKALAELLAQGMTYTEAARRMCCRRETIYRLVKDGQVPGISYKSQRIRIV